MSDGDLRGPNRRDFIKSITLLVGGFIGSLIAGPSVVYLFSPASQVGESTGWISLGEFNNFPIGVPRLAEFTLTRVNGWEHTGMPYGVFVVRTGEASVRAFSNICTHLGCRVTWHADIGNYVSPCHDGHFDIMGRNISGPPPRPLDEYRTKIEDGTLYVQLPALRRSA